MTRDGSGYLILKLENRFLGDIELIAPETIASITMISSAVTRAFSPISRTLPVTT